jgi:thiamine-phosphate pyrophosphorylase
MPVFALGGVLPSFVAECRKAGAYGVAVMGPVLRDPSVVADYLSALEEAR